MTLGFQLLVCVILFGICYGLKTLNSQVTQTFKTEYFDKLGDNFIADEIESVAKYVQVTERTDENTDSEKNPSKNGQTTQTTETTTEAALSAKIKSAGGVDVAVNSENDVPSNVSVNNYTLSKKMVLPVKGEISSEFGVRIHPIDGDLRFHAGTDIAASQGTPVYAAFDGTVTKAEYDQWNGYHIKLQHENDIMTVYCHCAALNVEKGDTVSAGDIIATVGSTGSSTGPHLHFELRINNVSFDPKSALDDAVSAV